MAKKRKEVVDFGFTSADARFKHQCLMQDFLELQKEAVVMKSKLEVSKQRKQILSSEVQFLRKRRELLVETKTMRSSQKQSHVQPMNSRKRNKTIFHVGNDASRSSLIPIFETNSREITNVCEESAMSKATPVLPCNASCRDSTRVFDLNQDSCPDGEESFLPSRATPGFDLNEMRISVCRNAREGSSQGGKRKVSWHDPVALRV